MIHWLRMTNDSHDSHGHEVSVLEMTVITCIADYSHSSVLF